MIDLRSDTVTEPDAAMREAMANAAVGDDVIDVDPTTAELQEKSRQLRDTKQRCSCRRAR